MAEGCITRPLKGSLPIWNAAIGTLPPIGSKQSWKASCPTSPVRIAAGRRLKKESLAVTVNGYNISQVADLSIDQAIEFFQNLKLSEKDRIIAAQILKEINSRLGFLKNVGLNYLTLSRFRNIVRGRSPENSLGNPDRVQPDGSFIYPGRTQHRSASAGQQQTDQARCNELRDLGQHGACGGT